MIEMRGIFLPAMSAMIAMAALLAADGTAGAAVTGEPDGGGLEAVSPIATIAILPVVAAGGNDDAARQVEAGWLESCAETGIRWMPADDVRAAIARAEGDTAELGAAAARQIWRNARVDSATARTLARALGVDAVLSIRLDRWELADGGRAMVGATAVLSGADGTRLWSGSESAGCGAPSRSFDRYISDQPGLFGPVRVERDPHREEKLNCALNALLARWEGTLPAAPALARGGATTPGEASGIE